LPASAAEKAKSFSPSPSSVRRCGSLSEATTARIQSQTLEQLESLAEALLDFKSSNDLAALLVSHS
jgi:hypothetical protein